MPASTHDVFAMPPTDDAPPRGGEWDCAWRDLELLVVDLETTGTDPERDRICEIAWERRTTDGRVIERMTSLVRAGALVGASQSVHGIDDAALAGAPALGELDARWSSALRGAVVVGHRIGYDLAFLRAAAGRGELGVAPERALDTQKLAQRAFHGLPTSLRGLCAHFELPLPSHRALPDVIATSALFDRVASALTPRCARDLWVAQAVEGRARMREDVLAALLRGVQECRVVVLTYRVPGRRATEERFAPWSVRGAHVEGLLLAKGVYRVLRGDRILRVEVTDDAFERPERWRSGLPVELE